MEGSNKKTIKEIVVQKFVEIQVSCQILSSSSDFSPKLRKLDSLINFSPSIFRI